MKPNSGIFALDFKGQLISFGNKVWDSFASVHLNGKQEIHTFNSSTCQSKNFKKVLFVNPPECTYSCNKKGPHHRHHFLAFFTHAKASAKRARSARHTQWEKTWKRCFFSMPFPVVLVWCSSLISACLRLPEKRQKITLIMQANLFKTYHFIFPGSL